METDRGKLGNFLREVIDMPWDEFCEAEADINYSGYEGSVFSLIRTCSEGKLGAIQLAIDRIDGKVETPVEVEYPKIFILFPEAKDQAALPPGAPSPPPTLKGDDNQPPPEAEPEVQELATLTLRETLKEMADTPRQVPRIILKRKEEVEMARKEGETLENKNIPLVKSVIAANLLMLAEGGKFEAITEVFDQIDGKLVEKIKYIGEDIFLTSYVLEAPAQAKKNSDGVYCLEAPLISQDWAAKLGSRNGR